MSDHLVVYPSTGWGEWKTFVTGTKVQFDRKQFKLGERLLSQTEFPRTSRVLKLSDMPHITTVTNLLRDPPYASEPVHPVFLLALASGIQGAAGDSIFRHMQYDMAMSPYLLTDSDGSNYIFLLKNHRERFTGEFQRLSQSDRLPRCTHIWGYPPEKEPDHESASFMFRPLADGKYGSFYS